MEWKDLNKFLSEGFSSLWSELAVQLYFLADMDCIWISYYQIQLKMKKAWEGLYLLYYLAASDLSLRRQVSARLQDSAIYQGMGFFPGRGKFLTWCFWRTVKFYFESQSHAIYCNKFVSITFSKCNTYLCTFKVDRGGPYEVLNADSYEHGC